MALSCALALGGGGLGGAGFFFGAVVGLGGPLIT